jgi:hypothetical protein
LKSIVPSSAEVTVPVATNAAFGAGTSTVPAMPPSSPARPQPIVAPTKSAPKRRRRGRPECRPERRDAAPGTRAPATASLPRRGTGLGRTLSVSTRLLALATIASGT